MSLVPVCEQRVDVGVGMKIDIAAASTVSTVWATLGDVFLAASAYRAVTAVTAFYVNNYFVNHSVSISNNSNKGVSRVRKWANVYVCEATGAFMKRS